MKTFSNFTFRYSTGAALHEAKAAGCDQRLFRFRKAKAGAFAYNADMHVEMIGPSHSAGAGGETYRRVDGYKAPSTPSRPPGHYSRVEKQSYFPKRRYADPPTRFP